MPVRTAPDAEDDRLVAAARDGDVRSLEVLLDRHQARILRVLGLMGVPAQDRDDVAQEVFLRVFRHLGSYRPGRTFAGWIYRVTVNAAHDFRQRSGRRHAGEASWGPEHDGTPDSRPDPGIEAESRELAGRLEVALGALPDKARAVFVLRELEGLETAEVGRSLGITRVTVRRHLGIARRALRRALEEKTEKDGRD